MTPSDLSPHDFPSTAFAGTRAPILYSPDVEQVEADEAETIDALNEKFAEIGDTTFRDTGLGLRSVHAKSHGLLRGQFRVLEVPQPYAQGLFGVPKTYPAMLRLSTSPGDLLDDKVSTPRGVALKIVGVEGTRLPGSEGQATQDFLMANGPAFTVPNAKRFLNNLKLLAATTDKVPGLKLALSAVLRGTERVIEAVGGESATLKSMGGHPMTHILGETFFSQVPFRYGQYVAKFSLAPISPDLAALKDAPLDLDDQPDGIRAAVIRHFELHGGEWEFRVQLCNDLEAMPVEDASAVWSEEESPFVPVARLSVPPQAAWTEQLSIEMDDGLSFRPWQGLAAHQPLGSLNRARRFAYPVSADLRSARGRCPVHEPRG